jgi:hypothetical protein
MSWIRLIVGCLVVLAMVSCSAVPEVSSEFDFVLGEDYKPPIFEISKESFEKPLIVLVQSGRENPAIDAWFQTLQRGILSFEYAVAPEIYKQVPRREVIDSLAQQHGCDTVLLIQVKHFSAYTPLRLWVDVVLERLEDGLTLWKGSADYDTGNRFVSNSARRYVQRLQQRTNAIDKSLSALRHVPTFLDYTAYDLAVHFDRLVAERAIELPPVPKSTPAKATQKKVVKKWIPVPVAQTNATEPAKQEWIEVEEVIEEEVEQPRRSSTYTPRSVRELPRARSSAR